MAKALQSIREVYTVTVYYCRDYRDQLQACFDVDVSKNEEDIIINNPCYMITRLYMQVRLGFPMLLPLVLHGYITHWYTLRYYQRVGVAGRNYASASWRGEGEEAIHVILV